MPDPFVLNKPWSLIPTPEILDDMVQEVVDTSVAGYKRIEVGSPHYDRSKYPGMLLVSEKPLGQFRVARVWSSQYSNQDLYNYDISYVNEASGRPVYVRRYLVRREQYVAELPGTNMTGVWQVRVTNGGSGYNPRLLPVVTIAAPPSGSTATAVAIVGEGGVVQWVRITSEGTGYTAAPAVTIAPPVSGVTATATAVIQQTFTKAVASITITAGGTGYSTAPTVTITGDGTGATAEAQVQSVSPQGVVGIAVTNGGQGFVLTPSVVITPAGPGSGATAEAVLEELRLSLVKEDAQQLPQDDPRASLFLLVTRVYQTTPGPVLRSWSYDEKLRTLVEIKKRYVLTSSVPAARAAFPTIVNGTRTEYQSTPNANISIQIVSSIPSDAPASYTFFTRANYRFPDVIIGTPNIAIAFAQNSSGRIAQDVGLDIDIREGYAGPCKARVTRYFTFDPNEAFIDSLPAITVFNPQAHAVITAFTYANPDDPNSQVIANLRTFAIPQTLHPALTFGVLPDYPGSGSLATPSIPATVPIGIPAGWIVADVNPSLDDRFGIWIYDVLEIRHP